MCGVGTIPFLGAGWFPDVFWIGGEVEADAMEQVQENLRCMRRSFSGPTGGAQSAAGAAACAWDCQALPLRDATVDVMVVDMSVPSSCVLQNQLAMLSVACLMSKCLRRTTSCRAADWFRNIMACLCHTFITKYLLLASNSRTGRTGFLCIVTRIVLPLNLTDQRSSLGAEFTVIN